MYFQNRQIRKYKLHRNINSLEGPARATEQVPPEDVRIKIGFFIMRLAVPGVSLIHLGFLRFHFDPGLSIAELVLDLDVSELVFIKTF